MAKHSGVVKFYNKDRKFGFIKADDGNEFFFHISGVLDEHPPEQGQNVRFEIITAPKGPKAVEVQSI